MPLPPEPASPEAPAIAGVGCALPPNRYGQGELIEGYKRLWNDPRVASRLERLHTRVQVGARHLALPMEAYYGLDGFGARNDAYIRVGAELGEVALERALRASGVPRERVSALFLTSVTGIATPSIDVRIASRLRLPQTIKRVPMFGLGCVAGASGLARASDHLRAFPDQAAALVSVELCSLTLQHDDVSVRNLIASGLFGDGAAAVVLAGARCPRGEPERGIELAASGGPRVLATRSVLYPDSEEVMGWRIGDRGFRIVLSASVPEVARRELPRDVAAFLAEEGVLRERVRSFICHPGGPKVLRAIEDALELPGGALALSWRSLEAVGNLSSASVLFVLRDTLDERPLAEGDLALLLAMGPGFCSELVLLEG